MKENEYLLREDTALDKVYRLQYQRPFDKDDLPLLADALVEIKEAMARSAQGYARDIKSFTKLSTSIENIIDRLTGAENGEA